MTFLSMRRHGGKKQYLRCATCILHEGRLPLEIQSSLLPSIRNPSSIHRHSYVTENFRWHSPTMRPLFSKTRRSLSIRFLSDEHDSSSTTQAEVESRQSITDLLLQEHGYLLGGMTDDFIVDAESALLSWTKEHSAAGFDNSLRLLQRLVQEQEAQSHQEHPYRVRRFLVNRVVDCWRICWCTKMVDLEPSLMLSRLQDLEIQGITLDNRALTMVIDGMLTRGNALESPLLAQWILDQRMEEAEDDPTLRPDSFLLTSVIRAWAKSGRLEGPEMAEGILDLMHELYDSGWADSGPNFISYSATMDAWSRSRRPEAPMAIDRLLDRMNASTKAGLEPDTVTYTLAIDAWARGRNSLGAERAWKRLQEMIQLYENGNDLVVPQASNFARVIYALAKCGDKRKAEEEYNRLQSLYEKTKNPAFKPNEECKKALLTALSTQGTTEKAKQLLKTMVDAALLGEGPMPKRSYFVNLLVAQTKEKRHLIAAKEAEKLLREMIGLAQLGYSDLLPDSLSFFKVAQAWSRIRDQQAAQRVESLLHLMQKLHKQTGGSALKPTGKFMEVVVATLCRSLQPDPQRASTLIGDMEQAYSDGDLTMKPSRGIYTNLMQAWVRAGKSNHNAVQGIFDKLNILYSQGHADYRPDLMVYAALMESWAHQGEPSRVQAIFEGMIEEYRRGHIAAKPDTQAFNLILQAWSFSENPNRGQRADTTFKRIEEFGNRAGLHLKPDAYTFVYMIRIWCKCDTETANEKATSYLRSMIENGFEPSFMLCLDVLDMLIRRGGPQSTQIAATLLEDLLVFVQSQKVPAPNSRLYRKFLYLVGESSIVGRNKQAQHLLFSLSEATVPKQLMPANIPDQ